MLSIATTGAPTSDSVTMHSSADRDTNFFSAFLDGGARAVGFQREVADL
jgi:hypothetical protein